MDHDDVTPVRTPDSGSWEGRAIAAEDRLAHRNLLFAQAEHKVKTAMTVVSGMAEVLHDNWDVLSTTQRLELVAAIRRGAGDAVAQAEKLLEEARAEIGALGIEPVDLDVVAALGVNVGDVGRMSTNHSVRLVAPESARAWVDPAALQQALGHLLENAIKYSPHGGTVSVFVISSGDETVIDVRDEGIGVPEDVDVFAPFERGPATGSPIRGSGLGLYIVRSLVTAMGGSVSCRRNGDGPGSTFTLRLPAHPGARR